MQPFIKYQKCSDKKGKAQRAGEFFQYQCVGALPDDDDDNDDDDVARVISQMRMQGHSKAKKTPQHLRPLRLYMTFPSNIELSNNHEHQLTPRDYIQTLGFYHKRSGVTPNTRKQIGDW